MQPGWKRFGSMGCPASTASGLVTCKVLHIDICTLDNELLDAPGISSDGSSMQPSLSSLVSLIYFIFGFGGRVRSSLLTNCRLRGMLWCCVNCMEERNSQEPQFKGSLTPLEGALATRFISSAPPAPEMLTTRHGETTESLEVDVKTEESLCVYNADTNCRLPKPTGENCSPCKDCRRSHDLGTDNAAPYPKTSFPKGSGLLPSTCEV